MSRNWSVTLNQPSPPTPNHQSINPRTMSLLHLLSATPSTTFSYKSVTSRRLQSSPVISSRLRPPITPASPRTDAMLLSMATNRIHAAIGARPLPDFEIPDPTATRGCSLDTEPLQVGV